MSITLKQKHLIKVIAKSFFAFVILILAINILLGSLIKNKLNRGISDGEAKLYQLAVQKVHVNILSGNVTFSSVSLEPDSALLLRAQERTEKSPDIFKMKVQKFSLKGIELFATLFQKDIRLDKISLENVNLTVFKGDKTELTNKNTQTHKSAFNIDSIKIAGISGIHTNTIQLSNTEITIIDAPSSDTLSASSTAAFKIEGLLLNPIADKSNLFKLDLQHFNLTIDDSKMLLSGGDYQLVFSTFSFSDSTLNLDDLTYIPTDSDLFRFAKSFDYTHEVYKLDLGSLMAKKIDLRHILKTSTVLIDSIGISELNLSILMDKSLPFNEVKRPNLPNHSLKNMNFPFYIKSIEIQNSKLSYQEKMPDINQPMTVTLDNLQANLNRVTSMKDSLKVQTDMLATLQADLINTAKMELNFIFPLYLKPDTFFFNGNLGAAHFPIFNQVSVPALGAKFANGQLNSIKFSGSANNTTSMGEFVMLYDQLEAEITKKDYRSKNKFFSWAANTAIQGDNPDKKGNTRVVYMSEEKIPYKGFGNFIWKTLEDGIIRTLLPIGRGQKKQDRNKKKQNERRKRHQ